MLQYQSCSRVLSNLLYESVGGMRNLTPTKEYCNKDTTSLDAEVSAALRTYLSLHFPDLASIKIEYEWAGIMGFSKDRNPLVGKLSGIDYTSCSMRHTVDVHACRYGK